MLASDGDPARLPERPELPGAALDHDRLGALIVQDLCQEQPNCTAADDHDPTSRVRRSRDGLDGFVDHPIDASSVMPALDGL
jgi:hypothetical protein